MSCRCCAHFRPISCAIGCPFPNIRTSHVALLFNPKSSPTCSCSQSKAHTSSPSSLLRFCRCSSSIRFYTQLATRSWVFCRCFAYKVGSAPAVELRSSTRHLLLCVLCLAICLCASPNLVGMFSLTGSLLFGLLLVVDVDIQLVYLFSVCYFVFGLVIAVVGAMNSVFGFVMFSVAIGLPVNSFLIVKLALLASGTLLTWPCSFACLLSVFYSVF